MRWRFTNPSNNDFYDFQINPQAEEEFGQSRTIEHGANTANTGFVRQQSDDGPLILGWSGTLLHMAQRDEFIDWYKLSKSQTIILTDHEDDDYEVILTEFKPTRQRTIRNPRDYANAPYWYWTYTMRAEVIRVISGPWA